LGVAAGATSRVRLLSSIALAPLYPAALLAKLGAALDVASGGRFELGIGIGGENPAEFAACGVPLNERGPRATEALDVIRRLWAAPNVSFEGRFNQFDDVTIDPRPVQRPAPPSWVSGRSDGAMRRAAEHATGWLPYMLTPEQLASSFAEVDRVAGRRLRPGLLIWVSVGHDRQLAIDTGVASLSAVYAQDFSRLAPRYCLLGTPDDVVEQLGRFTAAGSEVVIFVIAGDRDQRVNARDLLAREVIPALRR
jgi:alkanesulfonate monooxygenase SsuD/methylene tetrahydromethanopterin reductase-like flavin-dependent oxidoreductase (luciferase family)